MVDWDNCIEYNFNCGNYLDDNNKMKNSKKPIKIIDDREEVLTNWLIGLSIATAIMFIFASYNVIDIFHQILQIFIME